MKEQSRGEYPESFVNGTTQIIVRTMAGHCCEVCGMVFADGTNLATFARNKNGKPIVGTVHHLDYNRSNNDLSNLAYLCQRCHFTIHLCNWKPTAPLPRCMYTNLAVFCQKRGIQYPGQPSLFGGME